MNKTLMLVICDFLLLSMLALARFDPPEDLPEVVLDATASATTAEAELVNLLEESLHAEEASRANLSEDLAESRRNLQEKSRALEARETALAKAQNNLQDKSAEAAQLATSIAISEAELQRIAEEKTELDAQRKELTLKYESTRNELETAQQQRIQLNQRIGTLKQKNATNEERLSRTEEKLIAREIALAQREAELESAQQTAASLELQRHELDKQLQIAQAERTLLTQSLAKEQQEKAAAIARAEQLGKNVSQLGQGVSQLGQDVSQLEQGVSTIADRSEIIQKEIVDSRPQTMSEIFTRFQNNRALITFTATERSLIGGTKQKTYTSRSILISDTNGDSYLVTHSNNSPFKLSRSSEILDVRLQVDLAGRSISIRQIGFLSADPRLIYIPLPKSLVDASGLETFQLALQPERWEEAVLVKNDESNFGRTEFRRLTDSAKFLKMNRPALGQLFSEFASTKGDLAFTKSSRFIGVLTGTKHAVVVDAFLASAILNIGPEFNSTDTANNLQRLKDRLRKLPPEVQ